MENHETTQTLKVPNTRRALAIYDATWKDRQKLWDAVETDADVAKADAADKEALDNVRRAFYEDTKDRNSLGNCMIATLSYLRELESKY